MVILAPKAIGEAIIDASGAAAEAMHLLREKLGGLPPSREYPFITDAPRALVILGPGS